MRRRLFFAASATLLLAAASAPPVGATSVDHGTFHGFNADAIFRAEVGTVVTDVDVGLITGRATGDILPGGTDPLPVAAVTIEVHDGDTLVLQAYGQVSLAPDEYTMDGSKLKSASVVTTIPAVDAEGNAFDVAVDVQWTAWGAYDHQVGGYTVPSEYVTRFIGKARESMSATGTVSWGSTTFDDWSTDAGFVMKVATYFVTTITK